MGTTPHRLHVCSRCFVCITWHLQPPGSREGATVEAESAVGEWVPCCLSAFSPPFPFSPYTRFLESEAPVCSAPSAGCKAKRLRGALAPAAKSWLSPCCLPRLSQCQEFLLRSTTHCFPHLSTYVPAECPQHIKTPPKQPRCLKDHSFLHQ